MANKLSNEQISEYINGIKGYRKFVESDMGRRALARILQSFEEAKKHPPKPTTEPKIIEYDDQGQLINHDTSPPT